MKTELKEILPIITQHHKGEDRQLVDARILWQFLGSKQEFANWIKTTLKPMSSRRIKIIFHLTKLSNEKQEQPKLKNI